ncbi:Major facilitator, sugar transporter-like, partial [Dillenia turbinata]
MEYTMLKNFDLQPKVGRQKEFEAVLRLLRGKNADISPESAEIRVGVGLMVLQQFGGANAIRFYASSIFESAGFWVTVGTIAMAIVQIPVTILGILLVDKCGRKPLLIVCKKDTMNSQIFDVQHESYSLVCYVSAAGTRLGCFIAGLSFLFEDHELWKNFNPMLVLIGILVFELLVLPYQKVHGNQLSQTVTQFIWSTIFPINLKRAEGSLVTLVNRFCSWIVSYTLNFLMEWSSAGTHILVILFVAKLVPETKGENIRGNSGIHESDL